MKILKLENLTFLGALLGLLTGFYLPGLAQNVDILGEIFILLLKLIIIPLIFVSVFLAIARQTSLKDISSLGTKTFFYFLLSSTLACLTGFLGAAFLPEISQSGITYENYEAISATELSFKQIILSFFSSNFFKSLAEGNIIHIVVISLITGLASLKLEASKKKTILDLLEALHDMVMILVKWILFFAPIGVFALVADVTASTDREAFTGLGQLFLAILIAAGIHALITLPALGYFLGRLNPYRFLMKMREPLLVALATASSSATLPVSTKTVEQKGGVRPRTAGFVLPLGATINMDGSSLYQTLVILFLAGVAGIEITLSQQLYIFFLILISSVGTAGIPGGGLLMMGAVLQNVGIPLEYLGIYLLVDRLWDPPVTMLNVLGDLFGAKIIDRYS